MPNPQTGAPSSVKPCDACGEPVDIGDGTEADGRRRSITVLINVPDKLGRKRLYGAYGHATCKAKLEAVAEGVVQRKVKSGTRE